MIIEFGWLARELHVRQTKRDPALVGVDGPSGSGKSTFAGRLSDTFDDVAVIPLDDFVSWSDLDRWWPRLEVQVLDPLSRCVPARYQQRDWKNDPRGTSLAGWRVVEPKRVVILEGVTATRQAISDRLTLAIWVEAPQDLRLTRGVSRDGDHMRDRWVEWMQREEAFFTADGTRQRAHVIVAGDDGLERWPGAFTAAGGSLVDAIDRE